MTDPTVELYLVHILPEWSPPAGEGEPGLLERWRHYTTRLSVHEAGHADFRLCRRRTSWPGHSRRSPRRRPAPRCAPQRMTCSQTPWSASRRSTGVTICGPGTAPRRGSVFP